jgi:SAM-dependent methyltransferase
MVNKREEIDYHDEYVSTKQIRTFESNFYSQTARNLEDTLIFNFLGDLHTKKVLFYGSGAHFSMLNKLCQKGAFVTAIDISPNTVKSMNQAISNSDLQADALALVMDCESLDFENDIFDVVLARSIIHHLDTDLSLKQIKRVLKPNGKFVALEPLGTNWAINLYRKITPHSRTTGEHPLKKEDLRQIEYYFPTSHFNFLYCLTIMSYFQKLIIGEQHFESTFKALNWIDQKLLMSIPFLSSFFWDVLVCSVEK